MPSANRRPDDPLSAEIDAALENVNLQDVDLPPGRAPGAGGGKPSSELKRGTIVGISGDDVFVELGPRMQGVVSLGEFDAPPKVGEVLEFTLHGREDDLWKLSRRRAQELASAQDIAVGALVKARVTGQNTGGLELRIGNLAAFMPASHVALSRVENLGQFLNQTLVCEVLEIDPAKRRVLVSRRSVLAKERDESAKESLGRLSTGQTIQGKVTRVEPFGAFVELGGGLEGLVHVSNISHQRVESAAEKLQVGQTVSAQIVKIEEGGKRIGLSMKALEPDPWDSISNRIAVDAVFTGKVKRVMDFGAFVEIEPGVEGLIHVSQAGARERVRRASDVFKVGDSVQVRVVSVEPARQRIALSRLDARGALLGSDDSVEGTVIDEALKKSAQKPLSTNLGNLFKKALKPPPQP